MTDVEDLALRFTACTLPKAEWTHVAHLTVGAWHVSRFGSEDALHLMRLGIRRLNESHGTPNTETSGYHETITRAYILLIGAFLECCPRGMPLRLRVDTLLAGPIAERNVLLTFYSPEVLMSATARATWVAPDLAPIGPICGSFEPAAG